MSDRVANLGGLTVQAHCLSGYSHYSPPYPLAELSPDTLSSVLQQASTANIYADGKQIELRKGPGFDFQLDPCGYFFLSLQSLHL